MGVIKRRTDGDYFGIWGQGIHGEEERLDFFIAHAGAVEENDGGPGKIGVEDGRVLKG